MTDIKVKAAEDLRLSWREFDFTEKVAALFEGLIGKGVLELTPVEGEVRGNLQDLFEITNQAKHQLRRQDPEFVEAVITPVAEQWQGMSGLPIGEITGFSGTDFRLSREEPSSDESEVYNLRLAGID